MWVRHECMHLKILYWLRPSGPLTYLRLLAHRWRLTGLQHVNELSRTAAGKWQTGLLSRLAFVRHIRTDPSSSSWNGRRTNDMGRTARPNNAANRGESTWPSLTERNSSFGAGLSRRASPLYARLGGRCAAWFSGIAHAWRRTTHRRTLRLLQLR